jgi:quercetin dioxygenase-like cupin family protein|nr:cupin domain-containing protein [Solirubrobacteraceae bacterium]
MRASTEPEFGSFDALPLDEPWPGVRRTSFDTSRATITRYEFEPGAVFPMHSHPQEQVTVLQAGEAEFTVGGRVEILLPGAWSVVPGGVEHGLRAGRSGARFLAIVVPRRERSHAYDLAEADGP